MFGGQLLFVVINHPLHDSTTTCTQDWLSDGMFSEVSDNSDIGE